MPHLAQNTDAAIDAADDRLPIKTSYTNPAFVDEYAAAHFTAALIASVAATVHRNAATEIVNTLARGTHPAPNWAHIAQNTAQTARDAAAAYLTAAHLAQTAAATLHAAYRACEHAAANLLQDAPPVLDIRHADRARWITSDFQVQLFDARAAHYRAARDASHAAIAAARAAAKRDAAYGIFAAYRDGAPTDDLVLAYAHAYMHA